MLKVPPNLSGFTASYLFGETSNISSLSCCYENTGFKLHLNPYMISLIKVRSKTNGFVTLLCVVDASYHNRSERKSYLIVMKI